MKSGFKKFWYIAGPGADSGTDVACEDCFNDELGRIEDGEVSAYGEIFEWMDLEDTDELIYSEPWEICCCMCGELVEEEPDDDWIEDAGCRMPCGREPIGCAYCEDRRR